MNEAWLCLMWTTVLSVVTAMMVAVVIHVMTCLIRRFAKAEETPSALSLEVEATSPDDEEIAVAVAVARCQLRERH